MIFDRKQFIETYGDDKVFFDGLVPDALKYLESASILYPDSKEFERIQMHMAIVSIAQDLFLRDLSSACNSNVSSQIIYEITRVLRFIK